MPGKPRHFSTAAGFRPPTVLLSVMPPKTLTGFTGSACWLAQSSIMRLMSILREADGVYQVLKTTAAMPALV